MKPKLRFSNFINDYEIKDLSDITSNISSGKISKQLEDGEYNVYGSMGIIGKSNFYDYVGEKVLVARVGANAGSVNKINEKCCISDNTLVLEPKDILNDYLYYALSHYNPKKLIFGSGQPLVTGGQLKKIKLGIPSKEEQIKVSNFLSLLDKKIELQSKKIEDLKLFKLCLMKEIFTSKNANTLIKIKDVAKIEKGKQVNGDQLLEQGNYYMLNGGINPSGYLNEYNRNENTITISEGGNSCGYVSFNKSKFWCGGHCYSILPDNINNEYLYQILKYNEKSIMDLRVGSGLPNIQKKDIENFCLNIHNNKEQSDIAMKLSKYDYKIELEEKYLIKLQSLKKGLMQNMFV